MTDPYKPIDCNFYDRLESAAVRHQVVKVEIETLDSVTVVEATIADLFSRDGVEYAVLVTTSDNTRQEVRLDTIRTLDGRFL